MEPTLARQMWRRFESVHAVTYFTPEAIASYEQAGLRGYWRGYFGGRTAPLGPVTAGPAVACYHVFSPSMVRRALPDIWSRATPEVTLQARQAGVLAALTRLSSHLDAADLKETADLAETAADMLDPAGHPIGAANMDLPRDSDAPPLARIWQATTTLREHRGDGHVSALVAYGFDGVEATVWRCTPGRRKEWQAYRGWTDDQWEAAVARLTERGWLDADGNHAEVGDAAYAAVEHATDRDAMRVWQAFGRARTQRLSELLMPLATAAYADIPVDNPIGLPAPTDPERASS